METNVHKDSSSCWDLERDRMCLFPCKEVDETESQVLAKEADTPCAQLGSPALGICSTEHWLPWHS